MRSLLSLFRRDIKAGLAAGSGIGVSLLFFITVTALTPFAIGADKAALAQAGFGLLWFFALLALLLGLDRLFQTDKEDGSLDILLSSADFSALALLVFVKAAAHWVITVLPLMPAALILSLLLQADYAHALAITAALLLGTPALTFIGAAGAALTAALPRGGALLTVLVLPLTVPVLIFGLAAAEALAAGGAKQPLWLLAACTLFFSFAGPIAAAAALKFTAE